MPRATINSRSVLVPDFLIFPILTHSSSEDSQSEDTDTDSFKSKDEVENMHPLCVSTIIQRVFSYLSYWQQKKCRLVCRSWNDELLQVIRKQSKVNLTKLLASSCIPPNRTLSSSLPSLLPTLQSLNLVCTSFIIEHESQDMGDFLRESNLIIKYIELRNISWDLSHVQKYILQELPYLEELRIPIQCALPEPSTAQQQSRRNSPIITEQYPKLKVVVVTYTLKDLHIYSRRDTHITPLLEILQAAPNLQEIYYPNIVQFTSPFENPARVLFKNIIYNGSMSFSRLTSLKIDTFLKNEDLYSLADRNLPLKSLQLTLTPDIGCDDLYELLYSIEPTLEVLTFTFRDGFRLCKAFPGMANMKNMSIIIWNGYLDNLAEIKKLNNLVIVLMEVDCNMIASGNTGGERGSSTPTTFAERSQISQLEIHAVSKGNDPLVIKTIKLSPWNLKRLTIDHATDQYLRLIFRSLRIIEELVILYGDWTETGLTGVPKEYCKLDIAQREFYAMGLKQFPGITDLKNLRKLILTGVITDISILLGVTKCRKIKSLELIARRYSKLSEISLAKIAEAMDLHYFRMTNFNPDVNISAAGLQQLKDKFSGKELCINF